MERFWNKVAKSESCWEWNSASDSSGYGRFHYNGRLDSAHRVSWILKYGPVHKGMLVLHKCDNRKCVNPSHLFLGTHKDNMQDMAKKGRHGIPTHSNKLNSSDVIQIYKLRDSGLLQREIALIFGISQKQVRRILSGENWKLIHKVLRPT